MPKTFMIINMFYDLERGLQISDIVNNSLMHEKSFLFEFEHRISGKFITRKPDFVKESEFPGRSPVEFGRISRFL